jgi:hypothetical protein
MVSVIIRISIDITRGIEMLTDLSHRWLVNVDGKERQFTYLKDALAHLQFFGVTYKYNDARAAFGGRENQRIGLGNGEKDIWLERITVLSATGERV